MGDTSSRCFRLTRDTFLCFVEPPPDSEADKLKLLSDHTGGRHLTAAAPNFRRRLGDSQHERDLQNSINENDLAVELASLYGLVSALARGKYQIANFTGFLPQPPDDPPAVHQIIVDAEADDLEVGSNCARL